MARAYRSPGLKAGDEVVTKQLTRSAGFRASNAIPLTVTTINPSKHHVKQDYSLFIA